MPDFDEMLVLSTRVKPISFTVDEDSQAVSVSYGDQAYTLLPKCTDILAAGVTGAP